MSARPIGSEQPRQERRAHPRRRLERLAYVDFGPENGGILIDVSETGLNFQVVGVMIEGQTCHVRFLLPGSDTAFEAKGKITWSNASKHGGGLQFVEISEEAQRGLREWIAMAPEAAPNNDSSEGEAEMPNAAPPNVPGEHHEQARLAAALAAAAPAPRPSIAGPGLVATPVRSVAEMAKQPTVVPAPRNVPPLR